MGRRCFCGTVMYPVFEVTSRTCWVLGPLYQKICHSLSTGQIWLTACGINFNEAQEWAFVLGENSTENNTNRKGWGETSMKQPSDCHHFLLIRFLKTTSDRKKHALPVMSLRVNVVSHLCQSCCIVPCKLAKSNKSFSHVHVYTYMHSHFAFWFCTEKHCVLSRAQNQTTASVWPALSQTSVTKTSATFVTSEDTYS